MVVGRFTDSLKAFNLRGAADVIFSHHNHNHPERVADLSLPILDGRIAQSASHGFSLLKLDLTNVIVVVFVIVDADADADVIAGGGGTTTGCCVATECTSRTELNSVL